MFQISENAVLCPVEGEEQEVPFQGPHRVVAIDREADLISLCDIERQSAQFPVLKLSDIQDLCNRGKIREGELRPFGYMLRQEMSDEDAKIRDERYASIEDFDTADRSWAFFERARERMASAAAKAHGVITRTINRRLHKFAAFGRNKDALAPALSRCGGRGKERKPKEAKRGRKRSHVKNGNLADTPENRGINITREIRELFLAMYDLWFTNRVKRPLGYVFKKLLKQHFSEEVIDPESGEKEIILKPLRPTYGQFKYWIRKDTDALRAKKAREGDVEWKLRHRAVNGRAAEDTYGPGDRYELDSSVLDLWAVSAINRAWLIGRPILYVIIDVWSRMIVGFHLALDGPSWNEARVAIFNALTSKVEFCKRYGIEVTEDEWPRAPVPHRIQVDQGELRAHKPRGLIDGLRVVIELVSAFRGDWKAIVESRFRILNRLAVHWLPGAVRDRERKRGERDYRLDACLTLDEITTILIRAILWHNRNREYPDALTRDMIADGVAPIPLEMWKWGLANGHGSPRTVDPSLIYCHLLPAGTATVRASGITWKTMRYSCEREIVENWRAKARNEGSWRIPIRYDPNSTDRIWIFDEYEGTFEPCDLQSSDERFVGRRVDEVVDWLTYSSLLASEREPGQLLQEIAEDDVFTDIVRNAKRAKKADAEGLTVTELLENVKEKRGVERLLRLIFGGRSAPASAGAGSREGELDEAQQAFRQDMSELVSDNYEEDDDDEAA